MKYIRTKDGIYEITKQYIENHCLVIKVNENRDDLIHESLGIKQACTIEELCDEFVVSHKEVNGHVSYDNNSKWQYELLKKKVDLDEWDIYGAIWTDKGLIYVAKMNDKGELELL